MSVIHDIAAAVFMSAFPYHFDSMEVKSIHYAMRWFQASKSLEKQSLPAPWFVISMPLVATGWATIFFVSGIVSYALAVNPREQPDHQPMCGAPVSPVLCIVALVLTTGFYVGCFVWSYRTLDMYGQDAKEKGRIDRGRVDVEGTAI
ncbi:hypothetical protein Hypma_003737 [Hypsizygus marmoreus]|uniref:Uncharacterized protein n=1 Tax=Hypsizygus marmoreus TaxID=39966 RepID=A0A369J800_HYPMA|nr:hypothetical protein Hypma_003737 [Hypsizygus marmoreus]